MFFYMLVHRIHSTFFLTDLHLGVNLVNLVLANKVTNRRGDAEDFLTKNAAFGNFRKKLLGDNFVEGVEVAGGDGQGGATYEPAVGPSRA